MAELRLTMPSRRSGEPETFGGRLSIEAASDDVPKAVVRCAQSYRSRQLTEANLVANVQVLLDGVQKRRDLNKRLDLQAKSVGRRICLVESPAEYLCGTEFDIRALIVSYDTRTWTIQQVEPNKRLCTPCIANHNLDVAIERPYS
ncbi:hypothetical protein [Burkholderia multivorans]|uniref:hypothetical protein n=1 Tax=Burkholderia multivorans TaxID=87883 RepID=UPI001C2659B2|nr:hypothetical protein [Burkholderia multivorans]MBU9542534.1 hypothetical protein [Burkholderia multivorans]